MANKFSINSQLLQKSKCFHCAIFRRHLSWYLRLASWKTKTITKRFYVSYNCSKNNHLNSALLSFVYRDWSNQFSSPTSLFLYGFLQHLLPSNLMGSACIVFPWGQPSFGGWLSQVLIEVSTVLAFFCSFCIHVVVSCHYCCYCCCCCCCCCSHSFGSGQVQLQKNVL